MNMRTMAMNDLRSGNAVSAPPHFIARTFLIKEWPYLLVLVLALFGIAYTSFSHTAMTTYWIVLAPFIGVICVISRWRAAHSRDERLRLIWTQALHWVAVLLAMHLMFV